MVKTNLIEAAGGVIYRRNRSGECEVVLIFRRGVWDIPKGKCDAGESWEACCIRELEEETGISGLLIQDFLTETIHEYSEAETEITKHTRWFSVALTKENVTLVPQAEEQIEKVEWVTLPEAKSRVGYQNLKDVLDAFGTFLQGG